jgi:hypothetical protein
VSGRHSIFARMWGVTVLAHAAGNFHGVVWPSPDVPGAALLLLGLAATVTIVRPRRATLLAISVLIPLTVAMSAPVLGNHWLLAGLVSLCYVLVGGNWERFEPGARVILLGFYSFAAFAKLNTDFLDPATSCGVVYANEWLDGFGLSSIPANGASGWIAAWGSALVELSVPVLLVVRRTRVYGVILAFAFHGMISVDQNQHFFDFTSVLLPLFVLFLPDPFFERIQSFGERLRPLFRHLVTGFVVIVGLAVTFANVTPITEVTDWWLFRGTYLWWLPYLGFIAWNLVRSAGRGGSLPWRLRPAAIAVVAMVFLNGLTPYLELKTAYSWTMYSNLVTVGGESNHLLVRSTLPLRKRYPLVEIINTDDPALQQYVDEGYLIPWESFMSYLAASERIRVVIKTDGRSQTIVRTKQTAGPVRWWWRWMPLRSVHREQPGRCQEFYMPAL